MRGTLSRSRVRQLKVCGFSCQCHLFSEHPLSLAIMPGQTAGCLLAYCPHDLGLTQALLPGTRSSSRLPSPAPPTPAISSREWEGWSAELGRGLGSTAYCQGRPRRHVELAFHWQIMKPNLQSLMPGETYSTDSIKYHPDRETAFCITPKMGVLSPHTDHEFILSFSPQEVQMGPSWWLHTIGSCRLHPPSLFFGDIEATADPVETPGVLPRPALSQEWG